MQVINHYDEQGRLMDVSYHINGKNEQVDSHGMSYLTAREYYKKLGLTPGFDTLEGRCIKKDMAENILDELITGERRDPTFDKLKYSTLCYDCEKGLGYVCSNYEGENE